MASSSSKLTTTTTTASKAIRRVKLTKTIQKTLPDVSVPPIIVQKVHFLSKNSFKLNGTSSLFFESKSRFFGFLNINTIFRD